MIKLLIVDDERTIRNGLARHMDWEKLGIGMVESAESAQEAFALCERLRPDIVLSDIRMRGMGGVEMCTEIHARYPECQIIFVSGYADKAYLKAAISLGAVDYIEKPVRPELLAAAVRKAIAACEEQQRKAAADETIAQSRGMVGQIVLRALAHGDYPENFERCMQLSGLFPREYEMYRFCLLRAECPVPNTGAVERALRAHLAQLPPIGHGGAQYGAFIDDRDFLILLCGDADDIGDDCAFLEALRRSMAALCADGHRFFLACGFCQRDKMELSRSYDYIQNGLRELFFKGWGRYATQTVYRPVVPVRFDKGMIQAFSAALSRQDGQEIDRVLDEIRRMLSEQTDANPEQIRNVYYSLVYLMNSENDRRMLSESGEGGAVIGGISRMHSLETIDALHGFVRDCAHEITARWQADDENCPAVLQVMRIMRTSYGDKNLSVKSLAESVYLTPTYLSGLFKKRTGKTIGQYLTELRIEYSLKLLMDKQLKLYHIAEMVGYEDPNYFAKIFKRHVGMTPSEYREKQLS